MKKGNSTLSGLVESESDDTHFLETMPTPDSATGKQLAAKRTRGRPKTAPSKVTKVKSTTRRVSGRLNSKTIGKDFAEKDETRAPLADKTNQKYGSETEEVDEFDQIGDVSMDDFGGQTASQTLKKQKQAKLTKSKRTHQERALKERLMTNNSTSVENANTLEPQLQKGRQVKRKRRDMEASPEKVIMETQGVGDTGRQEEEEQAEDTIKIISKKSATQNSHLQSRQLSLHRRRAGSASDNERTDSVIRRKLGEITKNYEKLQSRYQDLREIGLKEAERNFERLKKQSEEKTRLSNDLIVALKADVATHTAMAKESQTIKKKLELQAAETAALQAQLTQMTLALNEAKSENKTLSAKLASTRQTAASVEINNIKLPGSAMKHNVGGRTMGTIEAIQTAYAAQLKEDLYSDLTGLIIRSVKRDSEEDIFDCIQTGRNGTLHFKLAAGNDKLGETYDDTQCSYTPQLDQSRDRALMEILPDYLAEDITFPRPHAARFYARVVKALTEKPLD